MNEAEGYGKPGQLETSRRGKHIHLRKVNSKCEHSEGNGGSYDTWTFSETAELSHAFLVYPLRNLTGHHAGGSFYSSMHCPSDLTSSLTWFHKGRTCFCVAFQKNWECESSNREDQDPNSASTYLYTCYYFFYHLLVFTTQRLPWYLLVNGSGRHDEF